MSEDLVWTVQHPDVTATERCVVRSVADGWRLCGAVVGLFEGVPVDARYQVVVDRAWATRAATVDALTQPVPMRLERRRDGR